MKVLIVDDSKLFQSMLVDFLENKIDISSVVSQGYSHALSILESDTIDFICVSMHLQDGDGISLSKKIRSTKKHKHTPIVLFTSEDSKELYVKALKSGVTEVFHKKKIEQLVNFIQRFTLQQLPISGRVLYVEDTLSQREVITSIFTSRGLNVDSFSTAEEALESFLEHDYDLVVTDIVLEGSMTGMALTNYIRRLSGEKGDVPILALTGFDDISRRIELFYLGVSDYVIKPVIEQELIARVRNLIKNKQLFFESLKQKQRAEKADKAKSEFLTNMSHELRTPLTAILGLGKILEMESDDLIESHRNYVSKIINAGNHLLFLINEILDLARIESGKIKITMEDIDIGFMVEGCLSLIIGQAQERGIEIENNVSGTSYHVLADMVRFKQILLNLLSNAIKYNRDNGKIIVDTEVLDNNILRVSITDTGKGLTKQQVGKLFVPFERLVDEHVVQGTGIGLVITKNLIELMSGSIGVESVIDKGSTFWVQFKIIEK